MFSNNSLLQLLTLIATFVLLLYFVIYIEFHRNQSSIENHRVNTWGYLRFQTEEVDEDHDNFQVKLTSATVNYKDARTTGDDHIDGDDEAKVDGYIKSSIDLFSEGLVAMKSIPRDLSFLSTGAEVPSYNKSCGRYATLYDIHFMNTYWQLLNTSHGTFYFYGAYYDNRNLILKLKPTLGPAVRILGMMDWDLQHQNKTMYYCQLWFENDNKPVISKVIDRKYFWRGSKGPTTPFLYTCNIPSKDKIPSSVSIVLEPCDRATNNLAVQYETPVEKKDFAVCVKGLAFPHEDISVRLVEWIELQRLLGADKIFLYELAVHPNTSRVLEYYQSTGYIEVMPLTLPGDYPNESNLRHLYLSARIEDKRRNELIPYNDCFYRNLYNYKFIAVVDTDEVIIPLGNLSTWQELLPRIEDLYPNQFHNFSSIWFRNAYFFDTFRKEEEEWIPGIPRYMHSLQHIYRSRKHSAPGRATKCFHNTESVLTVHNHLAIHCLGRCVKIKVNETVAQMHHYKPRCPEEYLFKSCKDFEENPVVDKTIWKYKDELIRRTVDVLKILGFVD